MPSDTSMVRHRPAKQHNKSGVIDGKGRASSAVQLKQGQINATKASFMSGVKVSTIVRQFRMEPSAVKKVISG
jgi:uncharacterized protein with FMN-binding domain